MESDLENLFKEEAQLQYEMVLGEYVNSLNMKLKEKLEEKDIASDFSLDVDYLLIYVTESEFEKLEIEKQSDWLFSLAVKDGDEVQDMEDDEMDDEKIIGFYLDQFELAMSETAKKHGLRNARLNFRQQASTHIMENIVYNVCYYLPVSS